MMSDLHQALYQFLWEHRFPGQTPEDDHIAALERRQEETLRASLTPAQSEQLDALLDTREERLTLRLERMFRAALSLGLELNRL